MRDLVRRLIFFYHAMVASEQLLIEAEKRSSGALREYFEAHLEEERDHAQWLVEDLASVGIKVQNTLIPVEAVEMVGSVYYMVFHVEPCALLGYMQALEKEEWPQMAQWERDYPASLLRTLKHHAEHDPHHAQELKRIIETLTPEQKALVEQTRSRTIQYIIRSELSHEHVAPTDPTNAGPVQAAVPRWHAESRTAAATDDGADPAGACRRTGCRRQ